MDAERKLKRAKRFSRKSGLVSDRKRSRAAKSVARARVERKEARYGQTNV